jgi:hypothetical protein
MNEIELLPGFETDYGAEFQANIVQSNPSDIQYRKIDYTPNCNQTKTVNPIVRKDTVQTFTENIAENADNSFIREDNSMNLLVYPNPSNGSFEISINDSPESSFETEIVDIQGKVVYSKRTVENTIRLNLSLPAGIYAVHVYNGNKEFVKKMIINN